MLTGCGQFITQTFTHASDSISINGLDFRASATTDSASDKSNPFLFPSAFSAPETVEYEQYDTALASRVTSLYAQLESLTTTVAQLRRDVPGKAARAYADALAKALDEDDADSELLDQQQQTPKPHSVDQDVEMTDDSVPKTEDDAERTTAGASSSLHVKTEWKLKIPFGTDTERERWLNGEMAEIYSDTLRTLLRLQGEYVDGDKEASTDAARKALATSMGMAERAGRAAEVVEKM